MKHKKKGEEKGGEGENEKGEKEKEKGGREGKGEREG
jgi:hypothetical protein